MIDWVIAIAVVVYAGLKVPLRDQPSHEDPLP